ncbi:MAG: M48 family metallopeptidase [Bacillota bacterium]
MKREIRLGDSVIHYIIKKSKRAKNARLSLGLEGILRVTVPERYPMKDIEPLLKGKEKWILTKMKEMTQARLTREEAQEEAASVLRYLGKEYRLVTILDARNPIRVVLEGDKALVTLPDNNEELLRKVTEAWYRWAAQEIFTERTKIFAQKMGVTYRQIFIKNQKTRWGSCSEKRNLNFNLRLVMAPLEIVDYIIIHELAHLKEMNHSRKFWEIVDCFCPNRRQCQAWLKDYGPNLVL